MPIPNSKKPTMGLPKDTPFEDAVKRVIEDEAAVIASAAKIAALAKVEGNVEIEQEFVSIAALASKGRDALVDAMRTHINRPEPEYVPPQPTERQRTRTEMEMDRGRKTSERHAASALAALQPKPDPSDGYTVPVFRPGDHVPNFDSKDPGARTLK